jgi:hypothetical protein
MLKDHVSQRILAVTIGCSALLLSGALFVLSVKWVGTAQAEELVPQAKLTPWDETLRGAVGLGIKDSTAYFVIWSQPNKFYKVDLDKAVDWFED